jgi:II/X family phage/plasmid replication protein
MIDYLTISRDLKPDEYETIRIYLEDKPQIMKYTPSTGIIDWQFPVREKIRSDSNEVILHVTHNKITLSGSPAISKGNTTNVFGTDNISESIISHVQAAQPLIPFPIGHPDDFNIMRLDITYNYDMGCASNVRQALAYLRLADSGRFRVRTQSETVYWNQSSNLRSGKAYHKGEHLRYLQRKRGDTIGEKRVLLADRLLRLELKLGSAWFRRQRKANVDIMNYDYREEHNKYFEQFIGDIEVNDMNLHERICNVAPTEGQGLSAYRTWSLIKVVGAESARLSMPKSTWYRHTHILKEAGLTTSDFTSGNIIPFRKRVIELSEPVQSWEELEKRAAIN